LVIYNNACVAWMARPPLALAINELPFGLSVFISFLLSVFYGYKDEPFSQYNGCYEVVFICTIIHLLSSILLVVSFFVREAPLLTKDSKNPFTVGKAAPELTQAQLAQMTDIPDLHNLPPLKRPPKHVKTYYWSTLVAEMFGQFHCWYYASYLAISIYAFTGFNHERHERHYPWFWYALLMMVHYFQRDAGKTVLESILKGAPGLYKTGKVGLVVVLSFSMFSFAYFSFEIGAANGCDTAYQCIFNGMDAGIHGDLLGLHGDDHDNVFMDDFPLKWDDQQITQIQWWVAMTFFVFWEFIFGGIIQGQIVDAFSELRDDSNQSADDLNKCRSS